jgi:preprotein translocase subunit SecF
MRFKGVDFFPHGLRLPIVKNRRIFIGASWAMAIAAAVLLATVGLNFGIDFKGGTMMEIRSKAGPLDVTKLREQTAALGIGGVQIQGFDNPTDALIRFETQAGGDDAQQVAQRKLTAALGDQIEVRRVETVGAAVSDELKRVGLYAVIASLLGILIYLWFRFEWQFAVAAVLALVHDVFITAGVLSLMRYEFDLSIVAALLTLAGYSVNDTVVVFDRIRENMRKFKKMNLWELIDLSINETLSRTILTASTVFLAVLALYFFGTEVIHGFAFTMLFGVLIGTWSSIFVAAPLLIFMGLKREQVGAADAKPVVAPASAASTPAPPRAAPKKA